jgi:hypothetical protein
MMCLRDRSIFLARSVTVLPFGVLSDRSTFWRACDCSTFTPSDVRATVLRHGLFGGTGCRQ